MYKNTYNINGLMPLNSNLKVALSVIYTCFHAVASITKQAPFIVTRTWWLATTFTHPIDAGVRAGCYPTLAIISAFYHVKKI